MGDTSGYTAAADHALSVLRDPAHFQWSSVTLFALVAFLYYAEIGKKNWPLVLAAAGTWCLELFAEIINALILPLSGHSSLWLIGGDSSFLVLSGLNIEISMMFATAYVAFLKILPEDPSVRILGLPNRWFFVIANSLLCVVVETLLNAWGVLVWDFWWWGWPHIWSVFLFAYAPSVIFLFWMYDRTTHRQKVMITAGLFALDVVCLAVFTGLGWI